MRRSTLQGMVVGLILIVFSAPLQSGYTPPQSNFLLGEVNTFLADFDSWNAKHEDLPFRFWEMTPAANKVDAFVLLFWFWLHADPPASAFPSAPPSSDNPADDAAIGFIVLGQFEDNPPTLSPNGGKDPLGLGGNDGNTWPPKDPPPPTDNDPPPQSGGSSGDPPGVPPGGYSGGHPGGFFGGSPGVAPVDPVPEPAALTLLTVGGIELLVGCWIRRRYLAAGRRKATNSSAA